MSIKPVNPLSMTFRRGSLAPPKLSLKAFNPPQRILSIQQAKSVPLKKHFVLMNVELKQDFEHNKVKIKKLLGDF